MKPIKHCWCGAICEGSTDQCATHNAQDRQNERYAAKQKVIRQITKVTPKRAQQNQEYLKLRKEYLEAHPCCEVEDCNLAAKEIHHQRGRENEKLLDTNYFMAICRKHHAEFTEHSKEAKDKGVSVSRTN